MNTLKTNAHWNWTIQMRQTRDINVIGKYNRFVDGQASNHTLWWFLSLMVHGNLILAIPAVLIYYYDAPVMVIAVTISCFFASLVANMGGSGIRVTLNVFFLSLLINLTMLLYYIL